MRRRSALQACAVAVLAPLAARRARAEDAKVERVIAKVGTNHGHVFVVSPADVTAGVEKTYDLSGTAGHAHAVTLGADVWKRLKAGEIVRMPSTKEGGHIHRLYVRVAPLVDPPEAVPVVDVTIGGKDDHELVINAADMTAKAEKTFDIQGIAPHTHAVKLTADDFTKLGAGKELAITSSAGDDHTHVVYLRYPIKKKS